MYYLQLYIYLGIYLQADWLPSSFAQERQVTSKEFSGNFSVKIYLTPTGFFSEKL